MAKRVIVIVLLVVLALFAYVGYNSYDTRRAGASGQVFSSDSARDRPKIETTRSSSSGAAQADTAAPPQESDTVVYPPAGVQATQAPSAAANAGAPLVTQSQQAAPAAPGGDTISPNPPNGMVFAGSGRYQLYRQGNLTWRLDTETGRSCVIFATDEEWKKPRVYKAGCGRN
jgi:hypothetical protein